MCIYYCFYNLSRDLEENSCFVRGNFCNYIYEFDDYPLNIQKDIFEKCIKMNNWGNNDKLLAVPNHSNYDILKFENNNISIDNSLKELFFTEELGEEIEEFPEEFPEH